MTVLDVVLNNADRKGGHVLRRAGRARCTASTTACRFHTEPKLRTVLWGWAGEPLRADEVEVLERLRDDLLGGLGTTLAELVLAARGAGLPPPGRPAAARGPAAVPGRGLAGDPLAAVLTRAPT